VTTPLIRPLRAEDADAVAQVTRDALLSVYDEIPADTPEGRERSIQRVLHLQSTDPDGAWVAEADGEVVGVALALVREGMWFLSLLMVSPGQQGKGLGRELLDASLRIATDRAWILSTNAASALRRYRRAGFDLVPCLTARGSVDRALIPATEVRETTWAEHGELVDDVVRKVRGAGMKPDLAYCEQAGVRLFVAQDGFALVRPQGLMSLGAVDPAVAQQLLWTVFAEVSQSLDVDWLAHDQQWAIDVCLDARLSLLKGEGHLFLRGQQPMSPYLPSGALG
jgi:predicted N-acetyltransferase YhbS